MTFRRLNLVAVLGIGLMGEPGSAQVRCPEDKRAEDLATRFIVSAGSVRMPLGAFLLVRKKAEVGAIRLTSIDPTSTDSLGKSAYESYYQANGSGSLVARNVVRETGELDLKDLKGPGRDIFIYRPAGYKALMGKWSFSFISPSAILMPRGQDFEFAPTSACDVSEIDVHDKRLRWLQFDRNASVILPLADLPK